MSWKTAYRSFYYAQAPEPEDLVLDPDETVPRGMESGARPSGPR